MKDKIIKGSIAAFEKEFDNIEDTEVQQEIVDIINKNNLKKIELTEKQQEEREKYFNGKKQIKKT